MRFSESVLAVLANLGHTLARAPEPEAAAAEIHRAFRKIARVSEVRIVAAEHPSGWREWISGSKTAGVRRTAEFPQPSPKGTVAYFEADKSESGYLWISTSEEKCRQALQIIAPHAGTSIMLHEALKRSQRSTIQERELAREAIRSRDEERRRIARELHDEVGQSLASLKLNLKWAEDVVRSRGAMDNAVTELSLARDSVGAILRTMRDLSHTLYPGILDSLGLSAAIKELLYQSTRRAGIEVLCSVTGPEKPLSKETAVGLYRCCQEAVNNVLRHSRASRISVEIVYEDDEVRVTVEDNGKGFDPGNIHETGGQIVSVGFWTIRQRVADLGGSFRLSTAPGNGTAVEICVPKKLKVLDARTKNKTANR